MSVAIRKDIFGWFDNTSDTPAHDPGMNGLCPVCSKTLERPVKTISLMLDGDDKSYFFRVHKQCWEGLSEHEKWLIESSLIDAIAEGKKHHA